MGLRSIFIPIELKEDLTAILLMKESLEDVSWLACSPIIHYFGVSKGTIYCAFSCDGSGPFDFFGVYSNNFYKFR